MAIAVAHEQRACPRVAVALEVRLSRKVGSEVLARTHDLSVHGACVVCDRPLRIDEELEFDLDLPEGGEHLHATARVLRQHRHDMYALRFEQVTPAERGALGEFVVATSRPSAH
jgi:hypothetical protein